ncbi:hypothetical protein [Pseudodesulfovibrio sp.]|uniref:hypothetical protein n=1 Tax=Pseudodesulfovibrio sp. TaxID=2035812 RepID=UPI00261C8C2C|nr:hypothetical protein [Pseudodesulfovibrio sp.]MDD3311935.1 hypothetical protein [Pseudodesulfovibrio sp.]
MLPLEAPLTPDPAWTAFLAARAHALDALHLGPGHPALSDARRRTAHTGQAAVHAAINALPDTDVFLLLNARLHAPDAYLSPSALNTIADALDQFAEHPNVRGLVFADPYLLQALSDARPATARRLEAVPSVNARLDSAPAALAVLALIDATAFKPPSRLVLDRALNRDMARLAETSAALRAARPGLKLLLIANEGCLLHCPFKPAHDAHIALANTRLCPDRTFAMNRDLGCLRRFLDNPAAVLASPFIRPEDADRYAPHVDALKLCGRNLGAPFLQQALAAYLAESHPGNLLQLLDTLSDLAPHLHVPANALPPDFIDHVTTCDKNCSACQWCAQVMARIAVRRDPGLERLR